LSREVKYQRDGKYLRILHFVFFVSLIIFLRKE